MLSSSLLVMYKLLISELVWLGSSSSYGDKRGTQLMLLLGDVQGVVFTSIVIDLAVTLDIEDLLLLLKLDLCGVLSSSLPHHERLSLLIMSTR